MAAGRLLEYEYAEGVTVWCVSKHQISEQRKKKLCWNKSKKSLRTYVVASGSTSRPCYSILGPKHISASRGMLLHHRTIATIATEERTTQHCRNLICVFTVFFCFTILTISVKFTGFSVYSSSRVRHRGSGSSKSSSLREVRCARTAPRVEWSIPYPVSYTHLTLPTICSV